MTVAACGYLRIGATDVDAWMAFGTDVLGLMDAERDDPAGARCLRMDDHPFRVMVEATAGDGLLALGLEYATEHAWQQCCQALENAGHKVTPGSVAEARRRAVTAYASTTDPAGNTLELYWGRELDYRPLVSPQGVPAFVTSHRQSGDLGFGHLVLPAENFDACSQFYTDVIGMGITDVLYPPGMDGAKIHFMHANNPRQHSLALFSGPHPLGVVHIMFEVPSLDDVGRAMDRAEAASVPFLATLGRHVNDNMCSVYLLAPGGIAVEYGCDGLLIDPATHVATVSTEGDLWGHDYQFPAG